MTSKMDSDEEEREMSKGRFDLSSSDDILTLVNENPLAWIVLEDKEGPFATATPVTPEVIEGRLGKLVGHVPRTSRVVRCLSSPCGALLLVLGPHGYVSPSWMSDRTQAPTWNFTSVQFVVGIQLVDDPAFLEAHLRDLTRLTERGRDNGWQVDEMGARMKKLAARIVAFEAQIISIASRFKVGQEETNETFSEIVRGLERNGDVRLVRWMRRFNAERP